MAQAPCSLKVSTVYLLVGNSKDYAQAALAHSSETLVAEISMLQSRSIPPCFGFKVR